jgi:hypothetical protein
VLNVFTLLDLCEEAATPGGLNEQVSSSDSQSWVKIADNKTIFQAINSLRSSEHFTLAEQVCSHDSSVYIF